MYRLCVFAYYFSPVYQLKTIRFHPSLLRWCVFKSLHLRNRFQKYLSISVFDRFCMHDRRTRIFKMVTHLFIVIGVVVTKRKGQLQLDSRFIFSGKASKRIYKERCCKFVSVSISTISVSIANLVFFKPVPSWRKNIAYFLY